MAPPVFLLPAAVAGGAVDKLVQPLRIIYAIVHRVIVVKASVIFLGCFAVCDTFRAQIVNILHRKEGSRIEEAGDFSAAVTDNTLLRLLKGPGIQRIRVIAEDGQSHPGPSLLLLLLFLWRFWHGNSVVVSPAFRIFLQCAQTFEDLPV